MTQLKNKLTKLANLIGFSSRRKFGFLHSSWEVIKARKTGTTHTMLDFVVFRLFYALALSGVSVFTLTMSNPYPIFLYFETFALMANTLYAFLFLRQVLAHNHHRRALGRRQKMPEQMIITDEIERGGQKYYISKKISILPMHKLSAYEKLVWTTFNISSTMTLASLLTTDFSLLHRAEPTLKGRRSRNLIVTVGFLMMIADVFANTIPMRAGHVIQPLLVTTLYFGIDKLNTEYQKNVKPLYKQGTWEYPLCIYILLCVFVSHMVIVLLTMFRDFLISLLDKSRHQSTQQQLRTQKRLARRKIMHEIRGPDGNIERIVLEHMTPSQEEFICWKENQDFQADWAGDSDPEDDEEPVLATQETQEPPCPRYTKVNENIPEPIKGKVEDKISLEVIKEAKHPIPHPKKVIEKKKEKDPPPPPLVIVKPKRSQENLEEIVMRLPTPPRRQKSPNSKRSPKPQIPKAIPTVTSPPLTVIQEPTPPAPKFETQNPRTSLTKGVPRIVDMKPKKIRMRSPPTPPRFKEAIEEQPIEILFQPPSAKTKQQQKPHEQEQQNLTDPPENLEENPKDFISKWYNRDYDESGSVALLKALHREQNVKLQQSVLAHPNQNQQLTLTHGQGQHEGNDQKPQKQHKKFSASNLDVILQHEHKHYYKHHLEHELSRRANLHQFDREIDDLAAKQAQTHKRQISFAEPHELSTQPKETQKQGGILKQQQQNPSGKSPTTQKKRLSRTRKVAKAKDPVYDPLTIPHIVNATATFHHLDAKLDRRVLEGKIPLEQVALYHHHPGIPVHQAPKGRGHEIKKVHSQTQQGQTVEKESVVAFHPLIQYYDVGAPHKDDGHVRRKTDTHPHGGRRPARHALVPYPLHHPEIDPDNHDHDTNDKPLQPRRSLTRRGSRESRRLSDEDDGYDYEDT